MTQTVFTVDYGLEVSGSGGNITGATNIEASGNLIVHDASFGGNITSAGNFDIDGNATIGGNLFVTGNINFSGNVTQITGNSGVFYGNVQTGVGAIYAGKQGFTPLPNTVVQVTGDDNSYVQVNLQNTNHGNVASMELAITADDGTDTTNYIDMGIASSTWDGTQDNSLGTAVARRDGYLYVQGGASGGNLVLGTTTPGYVVKFNAGGPGLSNTIAQISNLGIISSGIVSATGNVRGGNVNTTGTISAAGNVAGNYILGNVAFATGIPATYGNSNVATLLADFGSNTISTSGNITAGNFIGNISITGNVTGTSANVSLVAGSYTWNFDNTGNLTLPGNTFAVNYANGTAVSLSGGSSYGDSNVVSLLSTFGSNTVSTTGNITAGNLRTVGSVSATGNINTGGNINSTAFTGGNIYWAANNETRFQGAILVGTNTIKSGGGATSILLNNNGANISVLGVTSTANSTSTSTGALIVSGGAGVAGNIYAGGLIQAQQISTFGNITTNSTLTGLANIFTNGQVSAAGNITGANFTSTATISASGNVNASGSMSVSGNATVSGTGGISIPNLPAFRVYGNALTTVTTTTNTNGVLNGNNWAVDYNQGSYLNSTTGTFTAPVAGLYQVNLVARVANNVAPTAQAIVVKNRATTNLPQVMWESAANCTVNHFGVSTVSKLAVGDTLNLVVAVGTLTFDQNDNWSVAFLG